MTKIGKPGAGFTVTDGSEYRQKRARTQALKELAQAGVFTRQPTYTLAELKALAKEFVAEQADDTDAVAPLVLSLWVAWMEEREG